MQVKEHSGKTVARNAYLKNHANEAFKHTHTHNVRKVNSASEFEFKIRIPSLISICQNNRFPGTHTITAKQSWRGVHSKGRLAYQISSLQLIRCQILVKILIYNCNQLISTGRTDSGWPPAAWVTLNWNVAPHHLPDHFSLKLAAVL